MIVFPSIWQQTLLCGSDAIYLVFFCLFLSLWIYLRSYSTFIFTNSGSYPRDFPFYWCPYTRLNLSGIGIMLLTCLVSLSKYTFLKRAGTLIDRFDAKYRAFSLLNHTSPSPTMMLWMWKSNSMRSSNFYKSVRSELYSFSVSDVVDNVLHAHSLWCVNGHPRLTLLCLC